MSSLKAFKSIQVENKEDSIKQSRKMETCSFYISLFPKKKMNCSRKYQKDKKTGQEVLIGQHIRMP